MGSYWWEQGAGETPSAILVPLKMQEEKSKVSKETPTSFLQAACAYRWKCSTGVCGLSSIGSSPMPMPWLVSQLCALKEGERQ